MKFVLQKRNFFTLLLDNVPEFKKLGGVLHLLFRVVRIVLVLARLQLENLLTLTN